MNYDHFLPERSGQKAAQEKSIDIHQATEFETSNSESWVETAENGLKTKVKTFLTQQADIYRQQAKLEDERSQSEDAYPSTLSGHYRLQAAKADDAFARFADGEATAALSYLESVFSQDPNDSTGEASADEARHLEFKLLTQNKDVQEDAEENAFFDEFFAIEKQRENQTNLRERHTGLGYVDVSAIRRDFARGLTAPTFSLVEHILGEISDEEDILRNGPDYARGSVPPDQYNKRLRLAEMEYARGEHLDKYVANLRSAWKTLYESPRDI